MLRSGQLIDICARRFKPGFGQGDTEFRTKISIHSSLEHKNIISFIGFCDEYDAKILIYEHAVNGSLDQHLSDPDFRWFQRLKICLGVARGLSAIHYDVVHCNINSSKILLDKDLEPKISGFKHSTKYPRSWRHHLLSSHSFDNTNMTPKYDVYCFGVLLFEVLYMVKPMKTQRQGIINPKLREQMDRQSLTFLTKIIDKCLNEHPVQRPTMDQVVKELEGVFELQWKHENHEHSTAADKDEVTSSYLLKLERLKIPLSEIKEATNGFDEAHFVAGGGFGLVYKGELDLLGIQNSPSVEGEQKKQSKTPVAIKCIKNRQDVASKEGFLTEIELLTSCKHQNVISLLGLYMEADDIILVYEYASKGSLSDYLGSTCKNINLTWGKRLEICLDIARGINYLHTSMEGKPRIIHRDIKSENILLDENMKAKIADLGLSKFHSRSQQASTIHTKHIAGTNFYVDLEYVTSAKYKKESDIYSFGVVLFEMLSGRLAYEQICIEENEKGLASIARRRYNEKTLKELIDPKMIDEVGEHIVTLNRSPNQESFEAFSRIAYQCLAETQAKRPTMEVVIKELENALNLQVRTLYNNIYFIIPF
ncbi:putative receptor-like protein kinase At5g59700 [Bidens hawaiensis]|uniref:putative receptor-like protein kinase At5g59700 n=2 Tax=Bidens hawaiensis TaxID=980011 RepID=UPI00404A39F4